MRFTVTYTLVLTREETIEAETEEQATQMAEQRAEALTKADFDESDAEKEIWIEDEEDLKRVRGFEAFPGW
jgi:hypothetical protein